MSDGASGVSRSMGMDHEPFAFSSTLRETIFEAIKGWEVRPPGSPLRGTTGEDAGIVADAITASYMEGLEKSGSAGQHYLAMRRQLVDAHSELDRVSIERSEDGAYHTLPGRIAILAGRYIDNQRELVGARRELDELNSSPLPDGWQGQLPAEGTRRRLILETILADRVFRLVGGGAASTALRLTDAIEEALQRPSEPSDRYRMAPGQPVGATAQAELPKPLFDAGDEIELVKDRDLALDLTEGAVGVVIPDRRRWCARCEEWHYGVRFEDREVQVAKTFMRYARVEVDEDRPPTDEEAPAEKEDGLSGEIEVRIGPDGYPWVSILGLIGLLENLGCAAYRDERVAEPGPEQAEDLGDEIDPDLPLWKVEASRGFDHLLNAARIALRV